MKHAIALVAFLATFFLSGCVNGCLRLAEAQNAPRRASTWDLQGASSPYVGGVPMQACGTAFCATQDVAADTDPILFPWEAQVIVDCDATSIVCWTMAGEIDVGALTVAGGFFDDAGRDGAGSCFRVLAGTYRSSQNRRSNFVQTNAIGRRTNVCDQTGDAGSFVRPCRVSGDCDTDGGACNAFTTIHADSGAFLYASSACGWTNE